MLGAFLTQGYDCAPTASVQPSIYSLHSGSTLPLVLWWGQHSIDHRRLVLVGCLRTLEKRTLIVAYTQTAKGVQQLLSEGQKMDDDTTNNVASDTCLLLEHGCLGCLRTKGKLFRENDAPPPGEGQDDKLSFFNLLHLFTGPTSKDCANYALNRMKITDSLRKRYPDRLLEGKPFSKGDANLVRETLAEDPALQHVQDFLANTKFQSCH